MPGVGIDLTTHEEILRFDEILTVVESAACLGMKKIKITGGEPLVRRGVADLIHKIKGISGIEAVTLTTNGVLLAEQFEQLKTSGLDGINISLDTLDETEFEKIAGVNALPQVLAGIDRVLADQKIPLKVNCVPLKSAKTGLGDLLSLAKDRPIHVRFIEMMPIGYGKEYTYIHEDEIKEMIENRYGTLKAYKQKLGFGPCHYYTLEGFQGKIGFISAMSHQFCSSCNRVRLTSQGYLKSCLQYELGCDLKPLLRAGATVEEIAKVMAETILIKPKAHTFCKQDFQENEENKLPMSKIGG